MTGDEIEYIDLDDYRERVMCGDIEYFDGPACKFCGQDMGWVNCWNCGGEGYFDGYEEDPLWYDDGDLIECSHCSGQGGWWMCCNKECKGEQ